MRRSTVVAVALAVVCLAGVGLAARPAIDARDRRDRTAAELDQARAEQEAAAAHRSDLDRQIGVLRARVARQGTALAALRAEASQVADERTAADDELATAQDEHADLTGELARTQGLADERQTASEDLATCTTGTAQAIDLLAAGDRPAGLARLQAVTEACRAAEAYLADGTGDVSFPWDFPDPFVLRADGGYYAYATNSVGGHVQVIASNDLRSWRWVGEALPALPPWADPYATWAPSVLEIGGRYALFFSARSGDGSSTQCIGVAFSGHPTGPFVDAPPEPLVCQVDEAGSIDPSPFLDVDGTPHLTWKSEGDTRGDVAKLWSAPLAGDATHFADAPTELLRADRATEGRTIEGPAMVRLGGQWFLLYSSNRWDTPDYRLDVAGCASASGPCTKPERNTVLARHDGVEGPGGAEVFVAHDGTPWIAYHAWRAPDVGFPNSRFLHVAPLRLDDDGWPAVRR